MAKPSPNPIDIQEFQFKLHCRLKIFNNEDCSLFAKPCNLLACASQYGLIFIGTNTASFQVITISSIERNSESGYHRRYIPLPSCPIHLAVNCDGTKLAVVTEKDSCAFALFYDISSFTKQDVKIVNELRLSITPGVHVLDICWNPTIPNIFTACKDDGTLGVYELKGTTIDVNELPIEAQATCMSWSPKGKQIAVGSRNGKITQYKPDLKAMKVINAPPLQGTQHAVALQWISNYQFIAVFKPPNPDDSANLLVIDSPKVGDAIYTNYEDICYGYGAVRAAQFYTIYQCAWNLLMVASSNSMEVGVMGCQGDQWTQWILPDTARAELPLTPSKQDSLPVGVAFDVAATEPIIWGETSLPPAPFLLMLSYEGLLCCFRAMNMKADAPNICQKPTAQLDTSGLNQFVFVEADLKETVPKVSPVAQPATVIQPLSPVQPSQVAQPASVWQPSQVVHPMPVVQPPLIVQYSPTAQPTTFVQPIKPIAISTGTLIKPQVKTEGFIKIPSPIIHTAPVSKSTNATAEAVPLVISPISSVSSLHLNETNAIQKEADMLIANLIREECETLEAELKSLLHKAGLLKVDLGTDTEAVDLVRETDTLNNFLADVVETNSAQTTEINGLKQGLIQTWAWYEDARFRLAQTRDTTLETLLRLQQLDPVSQRYLTEFKQTSYYLDSQLQQAGHVLDDQWSDFQDKIKKVIRLKIPTMETIYQAMVRHSFILEKQKYILKDISSRNRALRSRLSGPSVLMCLNSTDLLEKSLKRLQLEPEQHFLEAQHEMVMKKQKHFTQSKIDKLSDLLKHRDITNVRINKPQLSNTTTNLQSLLQSSPMMKKYTEASLIGAGLSPITTKHTMPWSSTFVQSTPKSSTFTIPKSISASNDQKCIVTSPQVSNLFTGEHKQQKFSVAPQQPNQTSAFLPTTQLGFTFTNKTTTVHSTVPSSTPVAFGTAPLFSFGTTVSTTSKAVTSPVGYDKSSLLSTKQDFGIAATSNTLAFSTSPQNIFTPAVTNKITTTVSFVPKSPPPSFTFKPSATTSTTFALNTKGVDNMPVFSFGSISSAIASPSPSVTTKSSPMFGNLVYGSTLFGSGSAPTSPAVVNSTSPSLASTTSSRNKDITSTETLGISNTGVIDAEVPGALSSSPTGSTVPIISGLTISTKPTQSNLSSTISPVSDLSASSLPATATSTSIFSKADTTKPSPLASFSFVTNKNPVSTESMVSSSQSNVTSTSSSIATFSFNTVGNAALGTSIPLNLFGNTKTIESDKTAPLFSTASTLPSTTSPLVTATTNNSLLFGGVPSKSIFNSTKTTNLFTVATTTGSISSPTNIKPNVELTSVPVSVPNIFGATQTSIFDTKLSPISETSTTSVDATTSIASVTTSIFPNTTSDTKFSFALQPNIFGNTPTPPSSDSKPAPTSTGIPILVNTPVTTTDEIFGVASAPSGVKNIFGTSSIFGAAVTSSNTDSIFSAGSKLFGSSQSVGSFSPASNVTTGFAFGTAVTSNSNLFSSVTTTASGSIFGGAPTTTTTLFGAPITSPMTSSIFGTQTTPSGSIFGTPTSTTSSIFGNATTTTSSFGSSPFTNTASSIFETAPKAAPFGTASTGSLFGQQSSFGSSVFGSPPATTTSTFGSNTAVFGSPPSPGNANFASVGFAKPFSFASPPVSTSSTAFGFGSLNVSSDTTSFGGQATNPFSKPFTQEQKSFGGGSIFGTPTTTTASIFGSNSPSTFGFGSSNSFAAPTFAQQSSFGQSPFGNSSPTGSFSTGNQSVAQSGFGNFTQQTQQKSGFGAAPVFGSSASSFGSPSSFGGSAFNTNTAFENSPTTSPGAFATPPPQQNSTFANLASQNTIGFGALAQQSPPPPQPNQGSFGGGSSFSTWR